MNPFQHTHRSWTEGIKQQLHDIEIQFPQPEHHGAIATLRTEVQKFCDSKVPTTFDELTTLSQDHTMITGRISHVNNMIHAHVVADKLTRSL